MLWVMKTSLFAGTCAKERKMKKVNLKAVLELLHFQFLNSENQFYNQDLVS